MSEKRKGISPRTRYKILEDYDFRCAYCGRTGEVAELHIDHIVPVSKGGTNHIDNLVAACKLCNLGKSNQFQTKPKFRKKSEKKVEDYYHDFENFVWPKFEFGLKDFAKNLGLRSRK